MVQTRMTTLQPHVNKYVRERYTRGEIGPHRRRSLDLHLRELAELHGHRPLNQFSRATIHRWLEHAQRLAPSSRRTAFGSIRGFCRWLHIEGHTPTDACQGVRAPRLPRSVPRAMDHDDIAALIAAVPDNRGRLIVALMVQMGLRRAEVARLGTGDVDRRAKTLLVVGKGGHQRMLPLPQTVLTRLAAYLAETGDHPGPLIRSETCPWKGLTPQTVGRLVAGWMVEAGVKTRPYDGVSPHALRHTAASDVLDGCGDLRVVQEMLGHASLQSTSIYLRRARLGTMRDAMEGRHYEAATGPPAAA